MEPLRQGDPDVVGRATAMTAVGTDVAIAVTRSAAPGPEEREYVVPLGSRALKVRWRDDGLDATAPTRSTLLPTRLRLQLGTDPGGPVLRGTATNRTPWVWTVLLVPLAAWFVVQLVDALGDGSTARTVTSGLVLLACLVGLVVAGTPRSTRHVRTLDLVDLAQALWERDPADRGRAPVRTARPPRRSRTRRR
ncbi:hypothetical protein G7072_00360 [Nocardioides sp. HDW12B]|uniref:hypothetical protein n=1 Tax=Nocardioides sp. HDW12B TaxID=2714939 RepID=UPI00140DD9A8|nr:hypothetical protein [Nocardioides sp. HDW12B]QIK64991.1 hypothetical protein G7072_00360 [Nocardioides sp. HDW12B]